MQSDDRVMSTQRWLPFTAEAIYAAFAAPEVLARWWGPEGFTNTFDTFEFKPGGNWLFTMYGPDGKSYQNSSVFEALEPNARIVIRHNCAPFFTLTITLDAEQDGTLLRWHQAFDDASTAQAVKAIVDTANEQNLDRLTRALAAKGNAQ